MILVFNGFIMASWFYDGKITFLKTTARVTLLGILAFFAFTIFQHEITTTNHHRSSIDATGFGLTSLDAIKIPSLDITQHAFPKIHAHDQNGFTLLELITTLLVISILGIMAVPNYYKYVIKAKKAEAYQTLGTMMVSQKTFYLENKSFRSLPNNPATNSNWTGWNYSFLGWPSQPDSSQGFKVGRNSTWDIMGYPIAVGTPTLFFYSVTAGQFDDRGSEVAPTSQGAGYPAPQFEAITAKMVYLGDQVSYDGGQTFDCNQVTDNQGNPSFPTLFGVNGAPGGKYDWALLLAKASVLHKPGTCTYIMYLMEASPTQAVPLNAHGFVEFDVDTYNFGSAPGDTNGDGVVDVCDTKYSICTSDCNRNPDPRCISNCMADTGCR